METTLTKKEIDHIVEDWIRRAIDTILKVTEHPEVTVKSVEGELFSAGSDLSMVIDLLTKPEIFRE